MAATVTERAECTGDQPCDVRSLGFEFGRQIRAFRIETGQLGELRLGIAAEFDAIQRLAPGGSAARPSRDRIVIAAVRVAAFPSAAKASRSRAACSSPCESVHEASSVSRSSSSSSTAAFSATDRASSADRLSLTCVPLFAPGHSLLNFQPGVDGGGAPGRRQPVA